MRKYNESMPDPTDFSHLKEKVGIAFAVLAFPVLFYFSVLSLLAPTPTVHPFPARVVGFNEFGGQTFIPAVYPKIRQIRTLLGSRRVDVSIDGGVKVEHARPCAQHGASMLVAGSAVFEAPDPAAVIKRMRAAAES